MRLVGNLILWNSSTRYEQIMRLLEPQAQSTVFLEIEQYFSIILMINFDSYCCVNNASTAHVYPRITYREFRVGGSIQSV